MQLGFHQAMWRGSNDDNDFRNAGDKVRQLLAAVL